MTVLLGAMLAAGVLLCTSPWLWPPRPEEEKVRRRGHLSRLLEEGGLAAVSPRTCLLYTSPSPRD